MFSNHRLCRWLAMILSICAIYSCSTASAFVDRADAPPYPEVLKISITRETWTATNGLTCEAAYPVTCLESVNKTLYSAQQSLWEDLQAHAGEGSVMELEATYRISGTKWAGFFLTGRILELTDETSLEDKVPTTVYLNHAIFTYDMESGKELKLEDVFPADSQAWQEIAKLHKQRLLEYYPHLQKNLNDIDALCTYEVLKEQHFLPSAGRLLIVTPLEPIHENHWQLVHTIIPYYDFRQWMNEEAYVQTDNSHRPIVAFSYDDGPHDVHTLSILRTLNNYGASASFFCLGRSIEARPDIVRRELDYGHTVGNHTYKHKYEYQVSTDYLREDRLQCLQIHRELTGLAAKLFRAPGGNCDKYVEKEIGWPIILWCYSAGDTGNNNAYQLADRIYYGSKDGDITLMHDIRQKTAKGSEMFLSRLAEDGFLFATVDELLSLQGITPQPNMVYRNAYPETDAVDE